MAYEPCILYERTPEEKRDVFLAWQRSNKAFFASGACHILAHMFLSLHHGEGYELIRIKAKDGFAGNHYYASNGVWAFDFNGWTLESELLETMQKAYSKKYPGWTYEKTTVAEGLPAHIASGNHQLRPPEYFPQLPWDRAYAYIGEFPQSPPSEDNAQS